MKNAVGKVALTFFKEFSVGIGSLRCVPGETLEKLIRAFYYLAFNVTPPWGQFLQSP